MRLYEIIKTLQSASGSNAKLEILKQNKDNELLKTYLKAVYDPAVSYWQTKIVIPPYLKGKVGDKEFGLDELEDMGIVIAGRLATGDKAKEVLAKGYAYLNKEGQELLELLIKRSVGAGVGDTMILKVWPHLYFIPGYMRCSLMDDKAKKHFSTLTNIIVQKKADGSFCYLKKPLGGTATAFTRAGSHYPSWLVNQLIVGAPDGNYVIMGELLVYASEDCFGKSSFKLLDRQTGNGIYNSILSGDKEEKDFSQYCFVMEAWDVIPIQNFEAGVCNDPYLARLATLDSLVENTTNIEAIATDFVSDMQTAYKIYSEYLQEGFEGVVVKDPASPWKDHTSPYNIKLKIQFEADYKIVGVFEGTKKYVGMLGGFHLETSDGLLQCDVGTGFTDAMRKEYWDNPPTGKIATIKANDVVSSRGSDTKSLFLPVFLEVREDKKEADTLEQVSAQLEAAKS